MTRARSTAAEPRRAGREVELSLVIRSDDPERILRRLARLRTIGPYILRPRGAKRIDDRYFDTSNGKLRKQGWALRLRGLDGTTTIGLKGRQRRTSTQTEDRSERERPYSTDAIAEIGRWAGLTPRAQAERAQTPDDGLERSLGVRQIQRRRTDRFVRDVLDEPRGPVLAELALDRVRFEVDGRIVRHYEVEVEAKRTGLGTKAAKEVVAELLARYPDELVDWPYGKLQTGKAIEELLAKRGLDALGADGTLTPRAYDQIRRYLER
jgi:inorganic triphosphatase YgiF